ncbi:XRE family transcriptional regulator [Cytobacillus firmus]|uniref:DNA polymerase n=1 Tax=Cytobacillus firmus TaxID=1399 RepID=UPI0018CE8CEC|nr:DNA polymerase [Cytobacillus firmus]MBG9544632.1 XRE family transcriptional regulator [Cytobacillus firmus]MBG9553626.1 XRE family transcriptional regulator [Cytobacillus firmus]MBG9577078.1 XRE family transcriptional regulator [Cytobacillus firmus]MED4448814.1 DNA polymerase [Cytobacillus firmus]MED4769345.1 DNA polymerase [Cytobacillus firmus]
MKLLSIDIETYSSVDLIKSGVYAYCESPDFEILLFAYAIDDEEVEIVDLASGEKIPEEILKAMTDPLVIKTAYNANFERTCLAKHFHQPMPPDQWRCSSVHALMLGLPGYLDGVAKCLRLKEQKLKEGKALIRYFSVPCKPTKVNEGRTRNLPEHDLDKWATFKDYCKQDVEVERQIRKKLDAFPITKVEQKLWELDQKINDEGVLIDKTLVFNAIQADKAFQDELFEEAVRLTGLENPNSPAQLKGWLLKQGLEVNSLAKKNVEALMGEVENPKVKRLLELRQAMSKTSVKKYEAMERSICPDQRSRGLLQFYGANRTGRWAGRLVQIHNLPRNSLKDLQIARELLKSGSYEALELLFESVSDVLSQLIRTAFIPSKGHRFVVADFSAIEARVIAWLAGERWRMDVFQSHGKIYEASAAQMFKVPIETIDKGSPLRQKGKIAELALGYGGSKGALMQMGALDMGLNEDELPDLVSAWREANPNIVKLWWRIEAAAIKAVKDKAVVKMQYGLTFHYTKGILFITLPSGRSLAYVRPRIGIDERFGKEQLTYEGTEQGSKQWGRIPTYGGKLTENIIQAIARDCLAVSMLGLDEAGYRINFHVHDEVILDVPIATGSKEEVENIMGQSIDWAPGLPLGADSFETFYYKKD